MKAVTVSEMRSLEDAAIKDGWTEERLMEQAGERLAASIARFFPRPGTIVAYLGKGHNAGDALVALRFLRERSGWNIALRSAFAPDDWAPLTRVKFFALGAVESLQDPPSRHTSAGPLVLLDALLGIGAKGALRDPLAALAGEMDKLRNTVGAKVAALDLPSGMDPDTGDVHAGAVTADVTFMIGAPKTGLLPERAANATGSLVLVPVDPLAPPAGGDARLISPLSIASVHQPRAFNFHKGTAGRVGILAGSKAYTGAAVMTACGALRGGAGLVTLHVPMDCFSLVVPKCPPEVIIQPCVDPRDLLGLRYDALVIGCGLHSDDERFRWNILELIMKTEVPAVIDAEALNLFGAPGSLSRLRETHVLTPHPGEFLRLAPELKNTPREIAARAFTERVPATLLLKGCRTLVTSRKNPSWFNPTGHPGMASGGQGDLLSGVIGALVAIGNPPLEAAVMGAWICGRAAERALSNPGVSPQSVLPTDVLSHLGGAFNDWAEQAR